MVHKVSDETSTPFFLVSANPCKVSFLREL